MIRIGDGADFAAEALRGFAAANSRYVRAVDGGVVRSTVDRDGRVAMVTGGGSGHYPAFAGLVGRGMAAGAACGNTFASPSAGQVQRVARAADSGGGVLLCFGNYAGDVMHFGQAADRLRDEGIDTRVLTLTDDIASAGPDEADRRRGIAGGLVVYKVAGAASDAGMSLDEVEAVARRANARVRTLGLAFGGCTLPGAVEPLFTVEDGLMSVGMGIHGEPGIAEQPVLPVPEMAELLVNRLLAERPADADGRVAVVLNSLGATTDDELFVLYGQLAPLFAAAGIDAVAPECGRFVTSIDMAGVSLSLCWLDDELERLWLAPADTPTFRRAGSGFDAVAVRTPVAAAKPRSSAPHRPTGHPHADLVDPALRLLDTVRDVLAVHEDELGALDAIAGDGDHGVGMTRGSAAAVAAARAAAADGGGLGEVLAAAGEDWAERAGGTSGALWGSALDAVGRTLRECSTVDSEAVVAAVRAALAVVVDRGGAKVGDKTLVDALAPFTDALHARVAAGDQLADAWRHAAGVARDAAADTARLRPALGRAHPLAERSVGHPDPGATSLALVLGAVTDARRTHDTDESQR